MGSFQREGKNVAEEIIYYVKSIFAHDKRSRKFNVFKPYKILLTFVTGEPSIIQNLNEYEPLKHGLYVQAKGREKGIVIVPNEVKTREHAIKVAEKRMKKKRSLLTFSIFPAIQFVK
jgi:hypothetical protein